MALGLLAEGPAHGYELFRRFKTSLGGLWRISESQFYAMLKRVEARGLAGPACEARASTVSTASAADAAPADEVPRGGVPAPRVLALSAEGSALFEAWLAEPTAPSSRLLHLEFLARLHFLARLRPETVAAAAEAQARALAGDIARLEATLPAMSPTGSAALDIGALSAAFRLSQLRAALAWIEESVLPAAAAAFSGSSRA